MRFDFRPYIILLSSTITIGSGYLYLQHKRKCKPIKNISWMIRKEIK